MCECASAEELVRQHAIGDREDRSSCKGKHHPSNKGTPGGPAIVLQLQKYAYKCP